MSEPKVTITEVDMLIDHLESKVALLKDWRSISAVLDSPKNIARLDAGKFEKSDQIDDKRLVIEDMLLEDYDLEIDSYGTVLKNGNDGLFRELQEQN